MNYDIAKNRLLELHDSGLTWRKIAQLDEYKGLKHGTLCTFATTDYVPKDPVIRKKLGLPEIITQTAYRDNKGRFTKETSR